MKKTIALILWTIPAVNGFLSLLDMGLFNQGKNGDLFAATYYFSSLNGNDSNTGTSSATPWKTMDKLRQISSTLKAGDIVLFERGSEWNECKISFRNLTGTENSPVTFKAYGTGKNPRFKGSKTMNSFTREGNIWKKIDGALPEYIADSRRIIPYVFINDQRFGVSRYPNTGAYTTKTSGTNSYLEDSKGWYDDQWKNGMIAAHCVSWDWSTRRINSNTSTRLNFDLLPSGISKSSTEYIINNHRNACDQRGEWAQQNDTLWIFYADNLNVQRVEVPVIDTMVVIQNCQYLKFEGLQFEQSVMANLSINNSHVTLASCNISDGGNALAYIDNGSYIDLNNSVLSYGRRAGIIMNGSRGNIYRNVFKNMISEGANNGEQANGSCIINWHCNGITQVHHNRFDSINIAYNGHWSDADNYIFNNVVNNYGLTIEDCGAFYVGGDFTNYKKYIRRNIILNAGSMFCHAVYMDYLTSNVIADSNTILNSNIAFNFHVCDDNLVRYNNIVYPAKDMAYPWNSAFRFDEYSYNNGGEGSPVKRNAIENNNVVFSPNKDELGSAFLNVQSIGENVAKNNKYFDPFTTDDDIIVKGQNYDLGTYSTYRLSDWNASTGMETGSVRNPNNWTMQSASGVSQQDFVKLLINPTDKDSVFDLRSSGVRYMDVNGALYSETITVPSYYSVILFYREPLSLTNLPPAVTDISYTYYIGESDNGIIGTIPASNPESYQQLYYEITGGNTDGLIGVNQETGELYLTNRNVVINGELILRLSVNVSDNGTPSQRGSGQAEIKLYPFNNPPIINSQNFTIDEGSSISTYIGKVVATDPENDQSLTFEIISGNQDGHFQLDAGSGELYLTSANVEFLKVAASVLQVRVMDNGSLAKNSTAYITVSVLTARASVLTAYYIDPENADDPQENGSIEHPYDAWNDVKWTAGYSYLQKRGTTASVDKINIYAEGVTLGDYGEGERPLIVSQTRDFAIRAFNKSNISIRNLHIIANDAISCIYFLGENCNNNLIENCQFEGSENGIRIIDGESIVIKYNLFYNRSDAIYSFAENTEVYYNIFNGNATGVYIASYLSSAKIYNNVFYDNNQGIAASYADLVIYNNIFYLTQRGDVAINHSVDKLISDHNIFYPEQQGFISIASKSYKTLDEYQQDKGLDLNSFSEDPMFKDIYNENFALLAESPGVDAGMNVGLDFDFLGLAVPLGGATDIGLIENTGNIRGSATALFQHDAEGLEAELSVYPNPSDGRFNLYVGVSDIGNSTIQVKDITGKSVYSQSHNSSESACVPIDISGKPSGTYIAVLQINDKLYTKRLTIK